MNNKPGHSFTYQRASKRSMDIVLSVLALPLLLPLLGIVAVVVRFFLGRPVMFKQERLGLAGRPFILRKFRTMTDERDGAGNLLPDSLRLTRPGRFLRAASLDELPEFINVLRGEMSIVGPRPLHSRYLGRYTSDQFRRHEVLPGITGWAQVNGRNSVSWEERFNLDVWYVEHWSLWLDIRIIALTILRLIRREGISQTGEATMGEFRG